MELNVPAIRLTDNFIRTSQSLHAAPPIPSSGAFLCAATVPVEAFSRYLILVLWSEAAGFVVGSDSLNLFRTVSTLITRIRIQSSRSDACSSTCVPYFLLAELQHMVSGRPNRIHADISHKSYDHTRHSSQYSTHNFHPSPDTSS